MSKVNSDEDELPPPDERLFLQSLIQTDSWDQAGWSAVGYLTSDYDPPGLLLVFQHSRAAERIFEGWIRQIGRVDRYDELRVSIIEGEIPGKGSGYSVTIGSDPANTAKRVRAEHGEPLDVRHALCSFRVHRMNPSPGSPHLARFKKAYRRERCFDMLPASFTSGEVIPMDVLSIRKRRLRFFTADSLTPHDVESVAL